MSITGAKQGQITQDACNPESIGNDHEKEHVNQIKVLAFDHLIEVPGDIVSGQTTGRPVHRALRITKLFDRSSPLLYQAMITGETLSEVEISWYRTAVVGGEELYYRTMLEGARIVQIRDLMADCRDMDKSRSSHMQEVDFCYDTISWSHEISNTVGIAELRK
jgi:type VI secretion system secreted protein Hcp